MKKLTILFWFFILISTAYSARLWSSGAEHNTLTAGQEFSAIVGAGGKLTITTGASRSGTYGIQIDIGEQPDTAYIEHYFSSSNSQADYYARGYYKIVGFSNAVFPLMMFRNVSDANKVSVRLKNDRTLILYNEEDGVQVGSSSSPLDYKKQYQIELRCNTTTLASTTITLKLDTVTVASGTIDLTSGIARIGFGCFATATPVFYMDDLGINNNAGTLQNSWLNYGRLVVLRPRTSGSTNIWRKSNGSAGDANNYNQVKEIGFDDATTYLKTRGTLNDTDFYAIDSFTTKVDSFVEINVVQMGVRFADSSGTNGDDFAPEIKLKGGVPEAGTTISPVSTTWYTNDPSGNDVLNYPLTLYDLPGASTTKWKPKDLDTTQIGLLVNNVTGSEKTYVSTAWLLVEYGYRKNNFYLQVEKDNYGENSDPTVNYGGDTTLWVGTSADGITSYRSILWFGIPAMQKGTFLVDSCKLKVYFDGEAAATNRSIRVAGIITNAQNKDWIEGRGTFAAGQFYGSSWDSTGKPDTTWTTSGLAPGRNLDTMAFNSPDAYVTFVIPVEWITAMINADSVFTGFVLINQSEGTASSRKDIASKEALTVHPCSLLIWDIQDNVCGKAQQILSSACQTIAFTHTTNMNNGGDGLFPSSMISAWAFGDTIIKFFNINPPINADSGLVWIKSTDGGSNWSGVTQFAKWTTEVYYRASIVSKPTAPDTLWIVASRANNAAIGTDSVLYYKILKIGTTLDSVVLNTAGYRASIEYQNGDTFWISYTTGTTNSAIATNVYYTTNTGTSPATWTLSRTVNLGTSNGINGFNRLIHLKNKLLNIVTDDTFSGSSAGSPHYMYRRDQAEMTTWILKSVGATDTMFIIDTTNNGHYYSATVTGTNKDAVLIAYPDVGQHIFMKKWFDSDSTLHNDTRKQLISQNTNTTVDNVCDVYSVKDTCWVCAFDEPAFPTSGILPNNYNRPARIYASVDTGNTWTAYNPDSLTMGCPWEDSAFSQVWKDTNNAGTGIFIDLTDSCRNATQSDWRAFASTEDTLFYGLTSKFGRITWYVNTFAEGVIHTHTFQWYDSTSSSWKNMSIAESRPTPSTWLFTNVSSDVYQYVDFDSIPQNWGQKSISGGNKYYIKHYVTTAFTTEPVLSFATPMTFNVYGGFVRNITQANKVAFMHHRGSSSSGQIGRIMFNKVASLPAVPPAGVSKPQHFKMNQIFYKDPAELKKRLELIE